MTYEKNTLYFSANINPDNVLWRCDLPRSTTPKLIKFMECHFKHYLICAENSDKDGKPVKEHFHLWGESLKNSKKHLTDSFTKAFPELTRKGRGGSHLKSQIKHLKEEYQFYYNFKNYTTSVYHCHKSHILSKTKLKSFYEIEQKIKIQKAVKHKFYHFCLDTKKNLYKYQNIINLYIDFCDDNNREPTVFDCEKKTNFVLMKVNKQQIKQQFIDNYSKRFSSTIV